LQEGRKYANIHVSSGVIRGIPVYGGVQIATYASTTAWINLPRQSSKETQMNKVVGLLGAISGLATLDAAQAATVETPNTALTGARSFAELLEPIPNALAVLRANRFPLSRNSFAQGTDPVAVE
jgi:hypothetical protein